MKTALSASPAIAALVFGLTVSAGAFAQQQYPSAPPQGPEPQDYPPPQAPSAQYYPPPPPPEPAPQAYPAPQDYPPPAAYPEPVAPPGAVWVGAPGECLYGNGAVYWCAPGVVFSGFPAGWDFYRYPVSVFAPGIVVDPLWFDGWRRGHPGFAFRGRIASEGERRDYAAHRADFIRNGARRPGPGYGRPDDHHDDRH